MGLVRFYSIIVKGLFCKWNEKARVNWKHAIFGPLLYGCWQQWILGLGVEKKGIPAHQLNAWATPIQKWT